ncbi:MAG TPA: hypothetical protein VH092_27005 [Urbifossiella sp.]|nr:hypothetical protein [Urbifossiella sp.]
MSLVFILPFVPAGVFAELVVDAFRAKRWLPGLNWVGASIGVLVLLLPMALMLGLEDTYPDWLLTRTLLFAGAIGAMVDAPLSIRRNFKEGRAGGWAITEALATALLSVVLFLVGSATMGHGIRSRTWGAPA